MTLSFGVTDAGFVLPSQQGLLALVAADQQATINVNVDVSSDSVVGQLNGVFTRQLMIAYEAVQVAYNSNDPDVVEGFLQTQLAKLTGTPRLAATQSTVALSCALTAGAILVAGTALAGVAGNPGSQWTPAATYTAATTGTFSVPFVSSGTGPIAASAGTITVITTPVTGWNGVTNPLDASPGTTIESDSGLRIRREQELQGGGAGNVDAIRAALLLIGGATGPFVIAASVLNNFTDAYDANGVPPHSTEAVIWDGPTAPVSNNVIAQVLWNEGAAGIRSSGALSGIAVDALGASHTVYFSRVTQIPVYLAFGLTTRVGYVGDAAFKSQVAAVCNGSPATTRPIAGLVVPEEHAFGGGESVDPYDVVMNTAGLGALVTGLTTATVAIVGTPASITSSILAVGTRQIAVFDSSRITVNGA